MEKTIDLSKAKLRRQRVIEAIGKDSVAIIFSSKEQMRNAECFFPFRQDSYFYYLTGFSEPESVLVLDGYSGESTLFCRDKDPEREIWDGFRYGVAGAKEAFGFEHTAPIDTFSEALPHYLKGRRNLYSLWGLYPEHEIPLQKAWYDVRPRMNVVRPYVCSDLRAILDPMRHIKDETELDLLRTAAHISAMGHIRAMQTIHDGMYEYQLEGEVVYEFSKLGSRHVAYNSIVAGGENACILHYVNNDSVLRDGQLIMIDAGAEYLGYAGDISRTFPVNKRFNPAQKDVYEAVLKVNKEVISQAQVGKTYQDLSELATKGLTQGLIDLGLLSGSLEENIENQHYRRFYMHGFGHWLGLDVHDVGTYKQGEQSVPLQPNMCLTVEPGLYIPNDSDIPQELRGMGIRIEDNIIIRKQGEPEVYTSDVPKEIAEIEAIMNA